MVAGGGRQLGAHMGAWLAGMRALKNSRLLLRHQSDYRLGDCRLQKEVFGRAGEHRNSGYVNTEAAGHGLGFGFALFWFGVPNYNNAPVGICADCLADHFVYVRVPEAVADGEDEF